MAAATTYFTVLYDNLAGGSFTAKSDTLVTWDAAASSGFIVTNIEDGTEGKLVVALYTGTIPDNNDTMTQGAVTADANGPDPTGDAENLLYPAYARDDYTYAASGAITWSGLALGATHSFRFDGQTANVVAGEILTFSGGQQCEVVTVISDAGASGELAVRWITALDTLEFPADNDTFTGDITGDGTLNGLVHPRCYSSLNLHRLLGDLMDDEGPESDDFLSMIDPTASERSTDEIVQLLGNVTITDECAQHMYGGSISQASGATLYSGLDLNITDPTGASEPIVILDDSIFTAYWKNAYMPNSIAGRVRLMVPTRKDGVDINGKQVTAKLLEFGDSYFVGETVLGTSTTGLALFSTSDGNNQTAVGTVAGAPYNTIVVTEGFQTIDYNNGNGAQPYLGKVGFGSASSIQTWERLKYIQRRGTAETLAGRNAQLYIGGTLNFAYDAEASGPFTEDEVIAWGSELPYTGGTGTPFTIGEVVVGGTSGARGRVLYDDGVGATGTLIVAQDAGATPFSNTETITGQTSGDTATTGTVVTNSASGTGILLGLDDDGTTGNLYLQRTRGVAPVDGQTVFGATSGASADVNVTIQSRVILGQCFFGNYTGTAFNPGNFGWGIDNANANASDLFTDLLGATQQPPNNQTGEVTGGNAGDRLSVYPWDGSTTDVNGDPEPDFNETTVATTALTAGVSTTIEVSSIPVNTPASGFLRVQRDSDLQYDLVEYSSYTGSTYTLVGTAPSNAAIGRNVMRAFVDQVWTTTGVPESYTAVQTGTNQVTIILRRGGVNPIKTFKGSATFGTAGFSAAVQRISDA